MKNFLKDVIGYFFAFLTVIIIGALACALPVCFLLAIVAVATKHISVWWAVVAGLGCVLELAVIEAAKDNF